MARTLPQKPSNKSLVDHREQEPMLSGPPPQPPSCMAFVLAGCLLSSIVLIGIALAIFTIIKNPCAVLPGPARRIFCREIIIRIREPVITEIRKLERLDTVELNLSTIVTVKQKHTLPPYTEILVYGVCGRAVAGVDLTRLNDSDLLVSGSTVTITLPQPEVFSVDPTPVLDVAQTEMRLVEGSGDRKVKTLQACNHAFSWTRVGGGTPELIEDAQEQAMIQFRARAEEEDVLERARRNAEKELARLLMFAGYEKVIFIEPPEPVGEPEGVFGQLGRFLQSLGELQLPEPEK